MKKFYTNLSRQYLPFNIAASTLKIDRQPRRSNHPLYQQLLYFIYCKHYSKCAFSGGNDGSCCICNLDYQLPTKINQSGFPEIAESINHMALRLKKNINRAYYYEIKQREAELSELQSKFNPHFLYNSLEMLRVRCHQNNVDTTANLISQLASIFRGFISYKTFISMTEELAFSKR